MRARIVRWLPTLMAVVLAAGCANVAPERTAAPRAAARADVAVGAPGAAAQPAVPLAAASEPSVEPGSPVEAIGIRLKGLRLTANGYVVDLRYRVIDPDKAQPLLDRKVRPVLVDEATGDRYYVPVPPIVGALRQTARNQGIRTDRDYFMLFANPDGKLKAGSEVALYLGDRRVGRFRVQAASAGEPVAASAAPR